MNNLQQVFYKFSNKNKEVLICLDDTFCFARSPETKPKNCISITSIMDKEDVYECLKEEGSAIINFKLTNKGVNKNSNINKILNSFVSSLVEFNFDPFIVTLLSTEVIISVVISDKDIGFVNDEESYYDSDDQFENDNGGDEDEDDEDEDEDVEDEDVEDVGVEDVGDEDEDVGDEDEDVGDEDEDVGDEDEDVGDEDEDKIEEDESKDYNLEEDNCNSCNVNINSEPEEDDDSIDGDTEEVETSDNDDDDKDEDPIKKEIRNELENMDKFKKNDFISFLARLNIKNINGKNTRHCNKKELHDFLIEKLEN
jgi:hypothetical protein